MPAQYTGCSSFTHRRSSGAHFACTLAITDWRALDLPRGGGVIKSLLLASGSYDMLPVLLSARSSYVHLSEEEVVTLSPVLHAASLQMPITHPGLRQPRDP